MSWVLYEGDCFNVFPEIEDKSIDMILCDLPYGTTACKWDTPLPLDKLWHEYKRVIKDNGAIVLTASQPFTSKLVSSNYEMFKYSWIWYKSNPSNIALSKFQPMKYHEDILIFGFKPKFNPIMVKRESPRIKQAQSNNYTFHNSGSDQTGLKHIEKSSHDYDPNLKNPSSVIKINSLRPNSYEFVDHPTQKPVALFEYLIKTYTNEGDLVLDNCAGSGTTGVACQNLNRDCILIEKEADYCNIIRERMATVETLQVEARKQQTLMDYCTAK